MVQQETIHIVCLFDIIWGFPKKGESPMGLNTTSWSNLDDLRVPPILRNLRFFGPHFREMPGRGLAPHGS